MTGILIEKVTKYLFRKKQSRQKNFVKSLNKFAIEHVEQSSMQMSEDVDWL